MNNVTLSIAAVALVLSGCATKPTQPVFLPVSSGAPPPAAVQAQVALAPGDEGRNDRMVVFDRDSWRGYKTGERFRTVFTGAPGTAAATLRLKDGRLVNEFVALGFAARVTYTLSSELAIDGKTFQIQVEEHDTGGIESAAQSAVDQAIATTAARVTDILAREAPPAVKKSPVADRLRALDDLLKDGAITADEHRARRAEILKEL